MEMGGYLKWWEENFRGREESLASVYSVALSKSLLLSQPHFSSHAKDPGLARLSSLCGSDPRMREEWLGT